MEGIGAEAASLAGHLKLANLCWIYDNNRITIEGATSLAFSEDVAARFAGYGWAVQHVTDANDLGALRAAFEAFRAQTDRPTLIVVDSVIGYGAPHKQGTHSAHGEPLGVDEVKATKRFYGWPEDATFLVPDEVAEHVRAGMAERGGAQRREWEQLFARYAAQYPQQAEQLNHMQRRTLPEGWDTDIPTFPADAKGMAGRDANAAVLNAVARRVPWLIGGSADLAPSNKSRLTFEGAGDFSVENRAGRNLHFGVREHAAAAVSNGLALSKLRAYQAGFLIFSDFQRGALRLSALMELPVIHVYTHDSIGLGEDGPTHQPVEQLATLRATPNVNVVRPADANETALGWKFALAQHDGPCALVLSRQGIPILDPDSVPADAIEKGAYVLRESSKGDDPDVILIGTGAEVGLCVDAAAELEEDGVATRVVSMPCWDRFAEADRDYQDSVLPPACRARVSVEAAATIGWDRWVTDDGATIGMTGFGASGPANELFEHFGFTPGDVAQRAKDVVQRLAGATHG
jgi:transketolase